MKIETLASNLIRLTHNGFCYFLVKKYERWLPFHPTELAEYGFWDYSLKDAIKQARECMHPSGKLISCGNYEPYLGAFLHESGLWGIVTDNTPNDIPESNYTLNQRIYYECKSA